MYVIQDIPPLLPVLRARARSLCRHHADAEDLVQDTVLRAMRFIQNVQDNLKGWLLRIMFHTFRDRHKRGAGRRGVYVYDNPCISLEELPGFDAESPDVAADTWDAEYIVTLIGRIPAPFGPTLQAYVSGSSYEELSVAEGVSLGAIRSRINRARERLRELL